MGLSSLRGVRVPSIVIVLLMLGAPSIAADTSATSTSLHGAGAAWMSFDAGPNAENGTLVFRHEGVQDLYLAWIIIYDANGTRESAILFHYLLGTLEVSISGTRPADLPAIDVRPLPGSNFETHIGLGPTLASRTLVAAFAGGTTWTATITGVADAPAPVYSFGPAGLATTRECSGGTHVTGKGTVPLALRVDKDRTYEFAMNDPFFIGFGRLSAAEDFTVETTLRLEGPGGLVYEDGLYALDLAGPDALPVGEYSARVEDVDIGAGVVFVFTAQPTLYPIN